jgi:hypothetical protein
MLSKTRRARSLGDALRAPEGKGVVVGGLRVTRESLLREMAQVLEGGRGVAALAAALGVSSHTVERWARDDSEVRQLLVEAYRRSLAGSK